MRALKQSADGRRRGVALTLVIFVVLGVVVLGSAMLYSNTQRALAAERISQGRRALFLAESGIVRARWRLSQADTSSAGYWSGAAGQRLDAGEDYYDVTVACADGRYEIVSIGAVVGGDGQVHARHRAVARVAARSEWDAGKAVFSESISVIPPAVTLVGDLYARDLVLNEGTILGSVSSLNDILGGGAISGIQLALTDTNIPGPDVQSSYYLSYTLHGVTYTAAHYYQKLWTAENPYNDGGAITDQNIKGVVFGDYYETLLLGLGRRTYTQIGSNVNFQGTLVVQGDLELVGDNITLRSEPGFPALVVTGDLILKGPARHRTIDGPVIIGGWITGDNHADCSLTINGALIFKGPGLFSPFLTQGSVLVNYNAEKARIRELPNQTPGPAEGPLHWQSREDWTFWDDQD